VNRLDIPGAILEIKEKSIFSDDHFHESGTRHLCHFLNLCSRLIEFPRPEVLKLESLLVMRKWVEFSRCNREVTSNFLSLGNEAVNSIFLGNGLCTGAIVQFFGHFFQTHDPVASVPLPIDSQPKMVHGISFYPINPKDSKLLEKTKHLRFLQAAYGVASSVRGKKTFEYVPDHILNREKLCSLRRLPDVDSKESSYPLLALIPILKSLEGVKHETGFLLGLSGPQNHSIALHLEVPYLLFDPAQGMAIANTREDLLLFIANILTVKYPEHSRFALLEFGSNAAREV